MKLLRSHTMRLELRLALRLALRLFLFGAAFLFVTFLYKPYVSNFMSNAVVVKEERHGASALSRQCSPAVKVAFMKTHKCGSSTIENIMYRHALRGDLNVAMPESGGYLSETELFNHETVLKTDWGKLPVHVFTLHNRWNYNEVLALMGPETKTFSVVRDPVDQFASLYVYVGLEESYHADLKSFVKLLLQNRSHVEATPRLYGRIGRNQIAFDWGFSPYEFDSNDQHIMDLIQRIEQQFGLVLVAERMEESLVLLADYLCWPLEYVTHLVLNKRKPKLLIKLDNSERDTLRKWLNVDNLIYDYFAKRLDEKIKLVDPTYMAKQVKRLRELNEELRDRCVVSEVGNEELDGKFRETNDNVLGYVIKPERPDCDFYAMSQPAYLELFRTKLTEKASKLSNISTLLR